jgi:hypothetical protein
LALALHAGLAHRDNLLRFTFLNPAAHEFYPDWEDEALAKVADLRAAAGAGHDDPAVLELVEELSQASEDFRRMWARHDVRAKADEPKPLRHPIVGDLILWHETLAIASAPDLRIFVSSAEPGSPSERALAELARLAPAAHKGRPVHRAAPDLAGRRGEEERPIRNLRHG